MAKHKMKQFVLQTLIKCNFVLAKCQYFSNCRILFEIMIFVGQVVGPLRPSSGIFDLQAPVLVFEFFVKKKGLSVTVKMFSKATF